MDRPNSGLLVLLLAGLVCQGCLFPQDDPNYPEPQNGNWPPRITGTGILPVNSPTSLKVRAKPDDRCAEESDLLFQVIVEDYDVKDTISFEWFIDSQLAGSGTCPADAGVTRTVRSDDSVDFANWIVDFVDPNGAVVQHTVRVWVTDGTFDVGNDVKLKSRIPAAELDSYTWQVQLERCPLK